MDKLRILVLGPQEVIPPTDGGREGIHGAITALSKVAKVTYSYPATLDKRASAASYSSVGVSVRPVDFSPRESFWIILRSALMLQSFKFAKYSTKTATSLYTEAHKNQTYDAVLCCHPHMFAVAMSLKQELGWICPIILREHNLEYELVKAYSLSLKGVRRIAGLFFAAMTKKEEIGIWKRADAVAFLTSSDYEQASRVCPFGASSGRFFVAAEGTPLPDVTYNENGERERSLLILLNKKATQSVLNVKHFLDTVWVDAHGDSKIRDISITITGVTLEQLSALTGISTRELCKMRVECTGFLDSLEPLFCSSLALVSPTYVGGGIRKKILEAMARFLPVIASSIDVNSTDYFIHRKNILEYEDVEGFIQAIDSLEQAENFTRLAVAARKTVEKEASWDDFAREILTRIESLLTKS